MSRDVMVLLFLVLSFNVFSYPTMYLERIGGSDMVSLSGSLMFVLENPSDGEPIISLSISVPSGFSTANAGGYVSVVGNGVGYISDVSGSISVNFSTPLMPGSSAYIFVTNIQNPSSSGSYSWNSVAYGLGNNPIPVTTKPGKTSVSSIVSSLGFRNIPYGRVVLTSGNSAAGSGLKQINIGNTWFTYIIYHPYDAGDSIKKIILSVPPQFATVAGTVLTITNLTTGSQLTNFTVGAIGANLPKTFYLSIPPVSPGSIILITLSVMTLPNAAGNYAWECYVEGVSGQIVKVKDMPGFSSPQITTAIAAPAAGWYGDVYPFFDITTRTMGWPVAGSSNNVYRVVMWRTTAWTTTSDPRIIFPSGFNPSLGGITAQQANGAGVGSWTFGNIGGSWIISNDITANGAVNNNMFVSITNVINPSVPGSYVFGMAVGDGVTVGSVAGYDRTVDIVSHLFSSVPMFGVSLAGGGLNTNQSAVYLIKLYNPTNSGDAIDKIEIIIPSGYSNVSVNSELITILNSSGQISSAIVDIQPTPTTPGKVKIEFNSSYPLGEGGSVYIPISVVNPPSQGNKVWSCFVSGLRDVTNIQTEVLNESTNVVSIIAYSSVSDGTNYVSGNTYSTNKSSDNIAWMIVTNGTFNGTSLVTITRSTNVPPATSMQSNEYIFIGNAYDFTSSLSVLKPVKIRLYYSNSYTNFIANTNVVANFKLARFDEISGFWEVLNSSVVGDGYVEVNTLSLGKYRIWEFKGISGATNVFSVGKVSGGTYTWDSGKLEVKIEPNSLYVDGYLSFETIAKTNSSYKPLPNYFVDIIGRQYKVELTSALNNSSMISIYYTDEESKGRVVDRFSLAYYDEFDKKWIVVPSYVDKENKRVWARTLHFSLWTLVENRAPSSDLVSDVRIYPNPSKDNLRISFSLSDLSRVFVEVYDFSGRRVCVIKDGEVVEKGLVEIKWNLTSDSGFVLPNGVYLVKIQVQSADMKKYFNNVYKIYVAK